MWMHQDFSIFTASDTMFGIGWISQYSSKFLPPRGALISLDNFRTTKSSTKVTNVPLGLVLDEEKSGKSWRCWKLFSAHCVCLGVCVKLSTVHYTLCGVFNVSLYSSVHATLLANVYDKKVARLKMKCHELTCLTLQSKYEELFSSSQMRFSE